MKMRPYEGGEDDEEREDDLSDFRDEDVIQEIDLEQQNIPLDLQRSYREGVDAVEEQ